MKHLYAEIANCLWSGSDNPIGVPAEECITDREANMLQGHRNSSMAGEHGHQGLAVGNLGQGS